MFLHHKNAIHYNVISIAERILFHRFFSRGNARVRFIARRILCIDELKLVACYHIIIYGLSICLLFYTRRFIVLISFFFFFSTREGHGSRLRLRMVKSSAASNRLLQCIIPRSRTL